MLWWASWRWLDLFFSCSRAAHECLEAGASSMRWCVGCDVRCYCIGRDSKGWRLFPLGSAASPASATVVVSTRFYVCSRHAVLWGLCARAACLRSAYVASRVGLAGLCGAGLGVSAARSGQVGMRRVRISPSAGAALAQCCVRSCGASMGG